jgi:hypothetical protein
MRAQFGIGKPEQMPEGLRGQAEHAVVHLEAPGFIDGSDDIAGNGRALSASCVPSPPPAVIALSYVMRHA